jgi:hypothetical protein
VVLVDFVVKVGFICVVVGLAKMRMLSTPKGAPKIQKFSKNQTMQNN